ncbi:MAG: hypothetical protein AB8G17_02920, partial [Gammaproteobacteria bacterium]
MTYKKQRFDDGFRTFMLDQFYGARMRRVGLYARQIALALFVGLLGPASLASIAVDIRSAPDTVAPGEQTIVELT